METGKLKGKKILIVDDDQDICDTCKLILAKESADVVYALTAKEGLALARSQHPDLVILDVMMEEADSGFTLANELFKEFKGLPIVMISAIAKASTQVFDTTQLPVSELIEKPIHREELIRVVDRLLNRK